MDIRPGPGQRDETLRLIRRALFRCADKREIDFFVLLCVHGPGEQALLAEPEEKAFRDYAGAVDYFAAAGHVFWAYEAGGGEEDEAAD